MEPRSQILAHTHLPWDSWPSTESHPHRNTWENNSISLFLLLSPNEPLRFDSEPAGFKAGLGEVPVYLHIPRVFPWERKQVVYMGRQRGTHKGRRANKWCFQC